MRCVVMQLAPTALRRRLIEACHGVEAAPRRRRTRPHRGPPATSTPDSGVDAARAPNSAIRRPRRVSPRWARRPPGRPPSAHVGGVVLLEDLLDDHDIVGRRLATTEGFPCDPPFCAASATARPRRSARAPRARSHGRRTERDSTRTRGSGRAPGCRAPARLGPALRDRVGHRRGRSPVPRARAWAACCVDARPTSSARSGRPSIPRSLSTMSAIGIASEIRRKVRSSRSASAEVAGRSRR